METLESIYTHSDLREFTCCKDINHSDTVQESWLHHHYLVSYWGTVVRFPQVWSTCPRRALFTETLLPGTS